MIELEDGAMHIDVANQGYLIRYHQFSKIVGRVLEVIETLNLPEKQEEATKNLIRREIYGEANQSIQIPRKKDEEVCKILKLEK